MPGEGKSFNAANLALTCAINGKKVLAIDFDLRKGTFSKYFNIEEATLGLSAFLSGKSDNPDSLIVHSVIHENLDVMPLGVIPPNPTSLLMRETT